MHSVRRRGPSLLLVGVVAGVTAWLAVCYLATFRPSVSLTKATSADSASSLRAAGQLSPSPPDAAVNEEAEKDEEEEEKGRLKSARKEFLIKYLSEKAFLSVEDGELQLELEQLLPQEERAKVAIVMAVTGGYDAGAPQPIHPSMMNDSRVDFFFFCDEGFSYNVEPPWRMVQRMDYFEELDIEVDLGAKNSISTLKTRLPDKVAHLRNMQAKHINHLAWRLPELRSYRYILYAGGGLNLAHLTLSPFYDRVIEWMTHNETLMFLSSHSYVAHTIMTEARLALSQERYRIDRVDLQAEHYAMVHGYDDRPGMVPWLGFMVYDAYSPRVRQLLLLLNWECQMWSLEDQVAFPFLVWKLGMRDNVRLFPGSIHPPFCKTFLQLPDGVECRTSHATSSYGKA